MRDKRDTTAKAAGEPSASADNVGTRKRGGKAAREILAEMRDEFRSGAHDDALVREYIDRLEKALESPGEVRSLADDCAARGVVWDDSTSEPATKTFSVEIRLGLMDRLKLGLVAKNSGVTPERFLQEILHGKFAEVCDATFDKPDGRLAQTYEILLPVVYGCLVENSRPARLSFKPAVMA